MILFKFKGVDYKFPENLSEITLGKFIDYEEKIEVEKPKSLKEFEETTEEKDRDKLVNSIESNIIINEWLPFFVDFICYWTGMSEKIACDIAAHEAFWLYSVINRNMNAFQFDTEKRAFTIDDKTFLYPKQPINPITKDVEYLKGTRIIEVIEAFQFEMYAEQLSKSKFGALPYIIGLICRKENEPLPLKMDEREEFISSRAEIMRQMPLSEALNFSFFLPTLNNILKKGSVHSGKLHSLKTQKQKRMVKRFGSDTDGLR